MKTLKLDVNALMTDVKIIGNIDVPKNGPLCMVSEKNLISILRTVGTIRAKELADSITVKISFEAGKPNFNVKILQDLMTRQMDYIQFAVDCGDLLIGDTTKIDEFLREPDPESAGYNESKVF